MKVQFKAQIGKVNNSIGDAHRTWEGATIECEVEYNLEEMIQMHKHCKDMLRELPDFLKVLKETLQ